MKAIAKGRIFTLIVKLLVVVMIAQGLPLQRLSRQYVWELDSEKITRILSLIGPAVAEASETETPEVDPLVFDSGELAVNAWHFHYSRHKFTVTNPGSAILTVTKTTTDKEVRGGFIFFNSKFIPLRSFFNGPDLIFEKEINLRSFNRLNVFLRGEPGASVTIKIEWADIPNPPPSVTFTADPQSITMGDISTLTWQTSNADSVSIDNNIGEVAFYGSVEVYPSDTTTYTLTASGPGGVTTEEVTVTVTYLPPTVSLSADPDTIVTGQSSLLTWTSEHAESCVIEPDIGVVDLNGEMSVSPTATTQYRIVATGEGGSADAEVTVTVTDPSPTVDITATPATIMLGESATLEWTSTDAASCTIEPDIGAVDPNGSISVSPSETTTYTITATGTGGTATAQVSVAVTKPLPTISFAASPSSIQIGFSSNLSWSTAHADTVEIDQGIGTVATSGTYEVNPLETTTYTLTATGPGGTATAEVTVTVTHPAPTVNFQATPDSITRGQSAQLSWTSDYASSATIDQGIGAVPVDGSVTVSPTETTTYTITLTGTGGTTTASVTVTVNTPPPTASLTADPETIVLGNASTLQWTTTDADSVTIAPDIGTVDADGSLSVNPSETTTYTLTATGPGGSATSAATITVLYPPTVTLSADPTIVTQGESTTLTWNATNADSCTIEPDVGAVAVSGSTDVAPDQDTTYTITATGAGGTATAQASVTVVPPGPPMVSLDPASSTIAQGESVTLTWTSVGATAAHIDNGVGTVATSGSLTVTPENTTIYTLTVTGPGGSANAEANVHVTGAPFPQPDGSFGDQYDDLIPDDSTVSDYDPFRFSVITGLIQDNSGAPLEDVLVSIHDNPEYGTAMTDMDGRFSIPVEGGGHITVECRKEGYIDVHRKIYVPWNDITACPTFVMLVQDTASSEIVFDGNADSIMTHKSTITSDSDGSRSCTMVFSGDNAAYFTDENGNDVHQLSTINVRATEYTTPESMPAELPPNSGFTYCAELKVDGADRVRFSDPVITWVDNFLDIDVGVPVPVGYYDRDKGIWVPSQNGVVVQLLDTDSDGIVDALDADGDGQPDDLNSDGQTSDEVMGLSDASSYSPGSTFWRIPVTHFSPWDFNFPVSAPSDAVGPSPGMVPSVDFRDGQHDCSSRYLNSYIKDRSCVYHEDIAIPGTDMTLHYTSKRTPGYRVTRMVVPASGDEVPASLKRIEVRLKVGGLVMVKKIDPLPNQFVEFVWDGNDVYGNNAHTISFLKISVGYVYQAQYGTPSNGDQSFGQSPIEVQAVPSRDEIILWQHEKISLHLTRGTIAEGWTLSDHHHVNPADETVLHKGDGTLLKQQAKVVKTHAGNKASTDGGWGDGGPAHDAYLDMPNDAVYDAEGNLYIGGASRIRKVDTEGIITTIAGGGTSTADGIPALDADIHVGGLTVDPDGIIYSIDLNTCRVRKIDRNGIITTVAGNGTCGFSGDGGPAVEASFATTLGLTSDANGNLYIADTHNHRVRKVDPNGIITTIAGTGDDWTDARGGYALQTAIENPVDVAVGPDGDLFICNKNLNAIYKVDNSGIITNYAGTGMRGYGGDGGPAVDAHLWYPHGISMDSIGNLYIADSWWWIIRKVDTNGIIDTVAGNQTTSYDDSGLPAISTGLPSGTLFVAADESDNFYIGGGGNRILRVGIPASFRSLADVNDIVFADDNGLVYTVSQSGLHRATYDTHTGVAIRQFEYDTDNNLTGIVDQFGNRTTIERDGAGTATAIISADGIRTDITIDSNNHITQVLYADGAHYDFEYTGRGLMTAEIDPKGNRYEHAYDSSGLITDVEDPELGHWQFARNTLPEGIIETTVTTAEGNTTTYRDSIAATDSSTYTKIKPNGDEITITRTDDNLSVTKEMPCGMTINYGYSVDTQYQYEYQRSSYVSTPGRLNRSFHIDKEYQDTDSDDAVDRITIAATLNGKTATATQDLLSSQFSRTSPEGRTAVLDYNPANLLMTAVNIPGINEITLGYNSQGRLESLNQGTRGLSMTYDSSGNMDSLTLAGAQMYSFDHDSVGRVTSVQRPDGSTVGFDYDANGNLELLATPSLISHRFVYNGVDNPDTYQTPLSGDYVYSYDRDRQLTGITFPSGRQITNSYTTTLLTHVQMPHADVDITYLVGERINTVTMGSEGILYGYDGKLVTGETAFGTLGHTTTYDYNNDFNIESITYAGTTTTLTYDNDGLITGLGPFTISRNADNGLPEAISDGALNIAQSFNGYGEIDGQTTGVGSQDLLTWSVGRDDLGRITEKTEIVNGETITYVYGYDNMNRLTSVTRNGDVVESYTHDAAGTRATETNTLRGITNRTFDYSDEEHLLTVDGVSYTYDLDGFLSGKTDGTDSTSYTYSVRGELLQVTLPDSTVIDYIHDPMGRRIAKQVNGSIVEKYLWSGLTTLLAVYDGSDNLIQRFEYAGGRLPAAMVQAGVTYYLAYDQVGSLRIVSDSAGNVVKRIDYDSFGNIIDDTDIAFGVPFGFAGGLHDRLTGLVRFGYRDYDPDTGRWTAKDPILFGGGDTDLYGYVQNNPVNAIDPTGEVPFILGGVFGGGAAGIIIGSVVGAIKGGLFSGGDVRSILSGALKGAFIGGVIGAISGGLIASGAAVHMKWFLNPFRSGFRLGFYGTKWPGFWSTLGTSILYPNELEGQNHMPCQ